MDASLIEELNTGLKQGSIVPCLGPGVLADVVSLKTKAPIPASSEALIDLLIEKFNHGEPFEARLMYEFSRAAMHIEHEFCRNTLNQFLTHTYREINWTRSALHDWLAKIQPNFVIDLNRDTQLIKSFEATSHYLVQGCARLTGLGNRFNLYRFDGARYAAVESETADDLLPVLFKPLGLPLPNPSYVASDADYVDYLTELKGRFGMPAFVRKRRLGKRFLLLGLRLNRDTERMIMRGLIDSTQSQCGWAFLPESTPKERLFLARHGITLIEEDCRALLLERSLA